MASPIFPPLFVLNIVEVIYFVNYQCCRYFHRDPLLAPTSKLSFGILSFCFTFLSGNQRPKDRTGRMNWMGNIINQTRSLWHVDWKHPSMFRFPYPHSPVRSLNVQSTEGQSYSASFNADLIPDLQGVKCAFLELEQRPWAWGEWLGEMNGPSFWSVHWWSGSKPGWSWKAALLLSLQGWS